MKIATISELKKELSLRSPDEVRDMCLRLARQKKETKELLHYLVFEANDEASYIQAVKDDLDENFDAINRSNIYWAKKSIRKILRAVNKFIRFSGNKQTEVELRIHFCHRVKTLGLKIHSSTALLNLYQKQLMSIEKALGSLHEDLQFDYHDEIEQLQQVS